MKHCDACRGRVAEYCKLICFEAQQLPAPPFPFTRKRNMFANFHGEFRCSRGESKLEQHEDVACVVCACKALSERRYRVFLRKTFSTITGEVAKLPEADGEVGEGTLPMCEQGDRDAEEARGPCAAGASRQAGLL